MCVSQFSVSTFCYLTVNTVNSTIMYDLPSNLYFTLTQCFLLAAALTITN